MPTPQSQPPRLTAERSALVVIDVQEKLLPAIAGRDRLVRDIVFLIDAAGLLGVPVLATEQYPQGLGPTTPALAERFPEPPPAKRDFSCCGAPGFTDRLTRPQAVLAGIEAHVCVLHTALDLLEQGKDVFLPADAVSSRSEFDRDVALRRLERAGAVITTSEAVVFEWTRSADHPKFKDVSRLVRRRSEDAE